MDIDILIASDKPYLEHAVVALTSACLNNPGNRLRIHFLHAGLDLADQQIVRRHLEQHNAVVEFLQSDSALIRQFHTYGHFTAAVYLRIFCDALLPQDIDRVIYLDCDVIVRTALDGLFAIDLEGRVAAAVRDAYANHAGAQAHLTRIPGVPGALDYFNSGVMLIDLKRYRAARIGAQALELLRRFSERFVYVDQDALNIVLHRQWKPLHPRWNVQSHWYESGPLGRYIHIPNEYVAAAVKQPAIIHYTGSSKPWDSMSTHPMQSEYWKYRQLTPYAAPPPG
jgi:lipopolysaccharide biosynthesis glycosyltransferase